MGANSSSSFDTPGSSEKRCQLNMMILHKMRITQHQMLGISKVAYTCIHILGGGEVWHDRPPRKTITFNFIE